MLKRIMTALAVSLFAGPLAAQDIPAAKGLDPQAKATLVQLIEAAQKEGMLNYADTIIQPATNTILVAAFKAYYGLPASFRVNYTLFGSSAMVTRVEQEVSANRVSLDVAAVASPVWAFDAHRRGFFLEYRSPQYAHYQAAFAAGLGVDGFFAFNGGYAQIPVWNADVLDFRGTTYKDVLDAAVPERFSIGDAAHSDSQLGTYVGLRQRFDVDFFKAIAAKKPAFVFRSEVSAQRILTGQDVIALSGGAPRVMVANQKGAKLKLLYPKDGFALLPQSTFILKAAPHPNAAKLWLDFVLSPEAQELLVRREAMISGRTGFASPIPDIAPELAALSPIKVKWDEMNADTLTKYRKEWEGIFTP
jgi:iron(III) transport system substrate-binding protein